MSFLKPPTEPGKDELPRQARMIVLPVPDVRDGSVQHPAHYTQGKIEVWDFILDQRLDYLEGNVIKYVCRHRHKGHSKQDLQKARAYLDRLIASIP